ncbi:MAG: hypothetical protein Q8L02_06525 [Candidatus Nitrotoga sp.]|nr:hypothetical protein [Candidatus Nitrotoga sp.]
MMLLEVRLSIELESIKTNGIPNGIHYEFSMFFNAALFWVSADFGKWNASPGAKRSMESNLLDSASVSQ